MTPNTSIDTSPDFDLNHLYVIAIEGLNAIEQITGVEPTINLDTDEAVEKWKKAKANSEAFYALSLDERVDILNKRNRAKEQS